MEETGDLMSGLTKNFITLAIINKIPPKEFVKTRNNKKLVTAYENKLLIEIFQRLATAQLNELATITSEDMFKKELRDLDLDLSPDNINKVFDLFGEEITDA